jgi:hypothetical protein
MNQRVLAVAALALAAFTGAAHAGTNVAAGLSPDSYTQSATWLGQDANSFFNGANWVANNWGNQWVQVDLHNSLLVNSVSYLTVQLPDGHVSQSVYVSDHFIGDDWVNMTPVATFDGITVNNTPETLNFAAVSGRYVEIVANGGQSWTALGNGVVTAVPEPTTYAMMLAGLGLLGFVARRRQA